GRSSNCIEERGGTNLVRISGKPRVSRNGPETSEGDWRPSKSNGFIRGVYSLCFFQLYASPRDDMGQPNFIATQNLESLTSSMKTPTYPPMKVASHSL
ncbi:hypothetical protein PSP61_005908, partial [Klebsiella pneumoniae]